MLGLGNILTKGGALLGFPNKYSFSFDGSNDYLDTGNPFESLFKESFTLSAWIKPDDGQPSSINSIINTRNGFAGYIYFQVETNGKIKFVHGANLEKELSITTDNVIFSDGASDWTHVAGVFSKSSNTSGSVTIYVNGQSAGSSNSPASGWNTDNYSNSLYNVVIGARNSLGSIDRFFDGSIDGVAFWNTALDATAIGKIGSKVVDLTKYSASNLKLWLRAGDKVLPESDASIARSDFYTDFDGTNDYVDCGDGSGLGFSGAEAFSLTAWVNPSSLSSAQIINAFGSDTSSSPEGKRTSLFINSSAKPGLAFWGNDVISDGTVSTNKWVHLVTTFAGGNRTSANTKIYIDGVSQTLTGGTASALDLSDMDFFHIGADQNESQVCNGIISNTSIYKTVLDAQTIKQFAKSRYTPMRDNRFSVVDFDGSDDGIETNADSTLADATYTFWAKSDVTGANKGVFGHGGQDRGAFHFNFSSDRPLLYMGANRFRYWNDNSAQDDGAWHHWAVVLDVDDMTGCKLYVDGVEQTVSQTTNSGVYKAYTTGLNIGKTDSSYEWEGSMAQFALYSDLKDSEFVSAQWSKGITADYSNDTNLTGYWRMGDDTSKAYPTIADSSSNSNDGTIENGASDDIVQQAIAMYDMGAFESTEELNGELNPNPTFSNFTGNVPDGWGVVGDDDSGNNISQGSAGGLRLQSDGGSIFAHLADVNVVGKTYHFSITITNVNDDDFSFKTLNTKFFNGDGKSAGTYTGTYVAEATYVRIFRDDSCDVEITALSIKEEIQSADLSDTYPAIIDVNEPVLGAELFTNGWTNDGNGSSYPPYSGSFSYDASANTVTATSGSSGTYVTNETFRTEFTAVANAFYKITFTTANTNPTIQIRGLSSVNHLDTGTSTPYLSLTYSLSVDGEQVFYVKANASATRYIGFRSGGNNRSITVSNFSIKQVSGNVGLMTNQATSDLVYSSVLPDQSFLAGVNSAYNFLDFDGTDAYVASGTSNIPSGDTSRTISAWLNADVLSGDQAIVYTGTRSTNQSFAIAFLSGNANKISVWGTSNDFTGTTTISTGTWYHVVAVYDSSASNLKTYINGTLDIDTTVSTNFNTTIGNNIIGSGKLSGGAYTNFFNGKIAQPAIWNNRTLSSTEVSAIYTAGRHSNLLDSYLDNLVSYHSFGALDAVTGLADTDSTIYDRSGNSNHSTTVGTATGDLKSPPNAEPNGYAKGDTNRSTTTP